jgi:hypothetical protein
MMDRLGFPEESSTLPGLDRRLRHDEVTGSAPQDSTLIIDKSISSNLSCLFKKDQPSVQKETPRSLPALLGHGLPSAFLSNMDERATDTGRIGCSWKLCDRRSPAAPACVLLVPVSDLVWTVSGSSSLILALLGFLAALAGDSPLWNSFGRVTFWGAPAMALTAGVGTLFGRIL